jgi:hypothetical protein
MNTKHLLAIASTVICASAGAPALAGEVYLGIGVPGVALGYAAPLNSHVTLRAEAAGGLSVSRSGKREGLDYDGELKASRLGGFADWYPFAGTFRLSTGITSNDIKVTLDGRGGSGTINGKPVNLTGESFRVNVKYKPTTPYLGLGWGHQAGAAGLGFYFDVGAQFGRFETTATTTVVGKFGVTQADVDAEVQKVRDNLGQYKVLPVAALGLSYRF